MRRFISGLLLIMMSMSIFAEGSEAEIQKEVSGINKSTATEGRILLEGQEKDPTLQAVDLNLVNNSDQKLETTDIDYNQTEQTDDLLADISETKTQPNYVVWGLTILGVLVAGLALSSK
ncbi:MULTISPECIES: hypothetical protein [Psychrilyobacter]|uniref:ESAT-6 secretion machinery protein EssA n=1 Tax=Psychrilyobacter piezotolerans TaxID=2293438 RepID=A0ABX9KK26_9FUSO|nr:MULTISPECIES: hypothetical protein [Psychrilyobacter]MCS5421427.1 hypothetical protein [Psychrilyobacter sp. S5]NDI76591.1 hypothetical protein [Psychrilyobacter piezotolerans]RDE65222.1 hypothetical protein DV867_01435 [Psychrilyobacter sp. S5]REI42840.1 hypothetical protein DYH56_01435 [Psychrilyobacter piezotolerans]